MTHPSFSLVLPSTKQKVTFRPFLVKEEKILLVAQSGGDQGEIVRAIKQVVTNCITDPSVNVDKFTTFDLEYFFIKLRAKSVQNIVTLSYRDNEDGQIYDVTVDLEEVEVTQEKQVSNHVKISDENGLTLKYPEISIIDSVEGMDDVVEFNFAIMQACLDTYYEGEKLYKISEYTKDEIKQFVDNLDVKTYQAIQQYIDAMPHIEHTVSYTNTSGKKVNIVLSTLTDFFTLG